MPSNPQNMTANLKAPLVFNLKNRKGKQLILNNPAYTTRHNILEEVKKRSGAADDATLKQVIEQGKAEQEAAKSAAKVQSGGDKK